MIICCVVLTSIFLSTQIERYKKPERRIIKPEAISEKIIPVTRHQFRGFSKEKIRVNNLVGSTIVGSCLGYSGLLYSGPEPGTYPWYLYKLKS